MFHSAALKLTLWYLAIIMLLSISFSLVIYHLSSTQLMNSAPRQTYFLHDRLPSTNILSYNQLRSKDLDDGLRKIRSSLVVFNLLVLVAGGAASYALARRTLEPIESALEGQKRFTGDASHELRTPLTVMQTENEVALRSPKLTKDQAVKQLKSNLEEVAKLKALSDGLLKLASFDNEQIDMGPVPLNPVLETAIDRWQKTAAAKNITIDSQLKAVNVRGDKDSLVELASILIDNAIKYSGGGTKISLASGSAGRSTFFKVTDQGQGIAAKDISKIFERFYQIDKARTSSDGYGLGLSIAKRIAEAHDGFIEVKSIPGSGSTFTVNLPTA